MPAAGHEQFVGGRADEPGHLSTSRAPCAANGERPGRTSDRRRLPVAARAPTPRRASPSPSPRRALSCSWERAPPCRGRPPCVPADQAIVMNSSDFASGWITRPNHGPRLNPTGNSPHGSSRAFVIPNDAKRSRTHSQALVRLSDPVSRGPIRLQSTSRWSITWQSARGRHDFFDVRASGLGGPRFLGQGQAKTRQLDHHHPRDARSPCHARTLALKSPRALDRCATTRIAPWARPDIVLATILFHPDDVVQTDEPGAWSAFHVGQDLLDFFSARTRFER